MNSDIIATISRPGTLFAARSDKREFTPMYFWSQGMSIAQQTNFSAFRDLYLPKCEDGHIRADSAACNQTTRFWRSTILLGIRLSHRQDPQVPEGCTFLSVARQRTCNRTQSHFCGYPEWTLGARHAKVSKLMYNLQIDSLRYETLSIKRRGSLDNAHLLGRFNRSISAGRRVQYMCQVDKSKCANLSRIGSKQRQ